MYKEANNKKQQIIVIFQCNPGVGLKAFFDMVHIDPKKLILFGAACSPVTDQIAKAAKHWNLVQVIFLETHIYDYNK